MPMQRFVRSYPMWSLKNEFFAPEPAFIRDRTGSTLPAFEAVYHCMLCATPRDRAALAHYSAATMFLSTRGWVKER